MIFADMVLREVADILAASIGVDDIALRLGGDEFMLFIHDCDKAGATVIGGMIAAKVTELFSNAGSGLEISVSIGMCVTAVVNEFSGLYRCAESTLQYVKTNGKKRAACYLDTSNELGVVLTQLYPDSHLLNTIDSFGTPGTENLADLALELLGKAKRLDDAVNLLLAKLGKQFGLDRVSIIDIDHDYQSFSYTYQWTRRKQDSSLEGLFIWNRGGSRHCRMSTMLTTCRKRCFIRIAGWRHASEARSGMSECAGEVSVLKSPSPVLSGQTCTRRP